MFDELRKIGVFLKRDFRMLYTYKFAFLTMFLNTFFIFFWLVLFGKMFESTKVSTLLPYGGNYIAFILVGSIGWGFLWNILDSTTLSLRNEMLMGTLESILLTPTKNRTFIFAYAIFGCIFGLLSMIFLFLIGVIFFEINVFSTANIYTIIIFILSGAMMIGWGFIFGGLTIWVKHIGQFLPLLQTVTMFFSGVYFPKEILPTYLQPISKVIPFYYSIEGLRKSLITTTLTLELLEYILILFVLIVASFVIGFYILDRGFMKAKKEGSLAFY